MAADCISSAAMWLVAHMTHVASIDPSGREFGAEGFKLSPEGGATWLRLHLYRNRSGTMDTAGMFSAGNCTRAHVFSAAARVLNVPRAAFPDTYETAELDGCGDSRLPTNRSPSQGITP